MKFRFEVLEFRSFKVNANKIKNKINLVPIIRTIIKAQKQKTQIILLGTAESRKQGAQTSQTRRGRTPKEPRHYSTRPATSEVPNRKLLRI